MEYVTEEALTRSIPPNVVDFAIASIYTELGSGSFAEVSFFQTSDDDVCLQVLSAEQHAQNILWNSHVYGWPWVVGNIGQTEGVVVAWAHSSPFIGNLEQFTRIPLYFHGSMTALVTTGRSKFISRKTRYSTGDTSLHIGILPRHKLSKDTEINIRRNAMSLAMEWSNARLNNDITRGIADYSYKNFAQVSYRCVSSLPSDFISKGDKVKSSWHDKALGKLDELSSLTTNWNGYGAEPPNSAALNLARTVIKDLKINNLEPDRILSSAVGGISLCFFMQKKYGEIECYNTGEVVAIIKITPNGFREIWEVSSIPDAVKKIKKFFVEEHTEW